MTERLILAQVIILQKNTRTIIKIGIPIITPGGRN